MTTHHPEFNAKHVNIWRNTCIASSSYSSVSSGVPGVPGGVPGVPGGVPGIPGVPGGVPAFTDTQKNFKFCTTYN